jgi:hypothetical protein
MKVGWFLLVLFCQFATAQINSGTIVVFQVIDGKVIVAADSRGILRGKPRDTYCKIAAFRHKVVFANSGNAASIPIDSQDVGPHWIPWNAIDEARSVVSRVSLTKQKTAETAVNAIADAWGARMQKIWESEYSRHPNEVRQAADPANGGLTDGLFATALKGTVAVAGRIIELNDGAIHVSIPGSGDACVQTPCAFGKLDIFLEYTAGKTYRAAQEKWSSSATDRIIRLVSLTIDHEAPEANGIVGVGGPIDVLELWKDGSIHWIRRKCNCPKNKN